MKLFDKNTHLLLRMFCGGTERETLDYVVNGTREILGDTAPDREVVKTLLAVQFRDGLPQIFKLEVPEYSVLQRMLRRGIAGQHRFKLTFTQMPLVLPVLCLAALSILFQEIRDLIWHRYLLTEISNDYVVHFKLYPKSRTR